MIRNGKKLPADVTEKIPVLIEALKCDSDIIALYAIGGLASGELGPLSDLDFVITLDPDMSKQDRFEKRLDLIGIFTESLRTDEIDLLVLNDLPPYFAYQAIKNGKVLFLSDEEKFIEITDRAIKIYLDFKYFRDQFNEEFLESIGYHG